MKTLSSYFLLSLTLLMAVSCTNSEFKKTKSGLLYKIYSDGKGEPAKKGQFLKVNVVQKIRDSLMYSTEGSVPIYMPVDSPRPVYNYTEILSLLRKGDSAVVVLLADSLQKKFGGQLPPFIKKKDKMTLAFKVLDVFASENLLMADKEAETAKESVNETTAMESYIAANHINAQKTEKGTYVVVESVGDGPAVDSGKQVSVRYTGKSFPSGKEFESNMKGPGNEPFKFVVGQGAVIPGLEDGLRKFHKGGKGTLYIPAHLAYGERPGPSHKPYESLIFDIVVEDVADAPKNAAIPAPLQRPPQGAQPTHR
jgi:FKBP-type peptidyl-prolyl cis-trans isomerase FkpA